MRLHDLRFLLIALIASAVSGLGLWISFYGTVVAKVLGAGVFALAGTVASITLYDQVNLFQRLWREATATRKRPAI